VAMELVCRYPGLAELDNASLEELRVIKGIGAARAAQIKAIVELAKRIAAPPTTSRPVIHTPKDAAMLVMPRLRYLDREHFLIIPVTARNQVLGIETVSIGHLTASLVHPRELFRYAIRRSAASLIAVHNHPSGDPAPSSEDLALTRRLKDASELLGITLIDHIVIGDGRFASLKELGYL